MSGDRPHAPVSSDPHAWLYPLFVSLRRDPGFGYLSPSHQFARLVEVVAVEHPSKAEAMREWSGGAQIGMLKWLTDVTDEKPPVSQIELWRVRKNEREVSCVAVYIPTGIDLRLMEGNDFRRTRLVRDSREVEAAAQTWLGKLLANGWRP